MSREVSLPYVAGFFDGEGSVGIYPRGVSPAGVNFRVQIVQNDSYAAGALLDTFQRRWGGCISGESPSRIKRGKTSKNWQVSGEKAAIFLGDIQPFTILKREQVDLALAWWRDRPPLQRDAKGRILARPVEEVAHALRISELLKALKR